ncbi:MAG: class I SAM-dependent methyltransferase [Alphaproteobacteria bacterium]|jgi:SAM-dependent methyltransferase|nr:class I SAM-dependent methyltransferase [Alphaproteobacteria bacterium]
MAHLAVGNFVAELPPLDGGIAEFLAWWFAEPRLPATEQAVLEEYYASFRRSFGPRMRRLYGTQVREAENLVRAAPGLRVLEVGCGLGSESLWLALQGARVTALDVRPDRLAAARTRQAVLEAALGRHLDLDFAATPLLEFEPEPFDLVWLEQTFHHLEPRDAVVPHLARLVAPGGYLAISEANALNPLLQAELLWRRGLPRVARRPGPDGQDMLYGVERVTTAGAIRRSFAGQGITCLALRRFRIFPNRPAFEILAALEAGLERNWLAPLLTHFNYLGRKTS